MKFIPLGLILCLGIVAPVAAQPFLEGKAVVVDGDTLKLNGQSIRLHGLDAPESRQTCSVQGQDYPCGKEATAYLKSLIGEEDCRCDPKGKDRYGRVIAICFASDGTELNRAMVRAGMALAYRRYSTDYVEEESHAKAAQLGLWRGDFISPWQWRKRKSS